jgi:hypothetical protein
MRRTLVASTVSIQVSLSQSQRHSGVCPPQFATYSHAASSKTRFAIGDVVFASGQPA